MLQVRDVPADVHRILKARAAAAGQSLSDYVLKELERSAATPTLEELGARIAIRGRVALGSEPERILRDDRDRG
jgi:plasmid stability protein